MRTEISRPQYCAEAQTVYIVSSTIWKLCLASWFLTLDLVSVSSKISDLYIVMDRFISLLDQGTLATTTSGSTADAVPEQPPGDNPVTSSQPDESFLINKTNKIVLKLALIV